MRHLILFSLALILSLGGIIASNPLLSNNMAAQEPVTSEQTACADYEATDCGAVEVNGVRFEAIVPEQIWQIPENRPGAYTPIQLRFRITNLSSVPFRFTWCCTLSIVLVDENCGRPKYARPFREVIGEKETSPTLKPGERAVFVRDGRLVWHNDQLRVEVFFGDRQYWGFDGLQPDSYELSFVYGHLHRDTDSQHRDPYGLWTGVASTPRFKIHLVESAQTLPDVATEPLRSEGCKLRPRRFEWKPSNAKTSIDFD